MASIGWSGRISAIKRRLERDMIRETERVQRWIEKFEKIKADDKAKIELLAERRRMDNENEKKRRVIEQELQEQIAIQEEVNSKLVEQLKNTQNQGLQDSQDDLKSFMKQQQEKLRKQMEQEQNAADKRMEEKFGNNTLGSELRRMVETKREEIAAKNSVDFSSPVIGYGANVSRIGNVTFLIE